MFTINKSASPHMQVMYRRSPTSEPEQVILQHASSTSERELIIVESHFEHEVVFGNYNTEPGEKTYKVDEKYPLLEMEEAKKEVDELQATGEEDRQGQSHMFEAWADSDSTHSTYKLFSVPKDQYKTGDVLTSPVPPNSELVYSPDDE